MAKVSPELMRELLGPPLVSITTLSRALGIGFRRAKEAADRGQVETVDLGEQAMVVTAPLKRKLGLEPALQSDVCPQSDRGSADLPPRTSGARIEGADAID